MSAADGTREWPRFQRWGFAFISCAIISTMLHLTGHVVLEERAATTLIESAPNQLLAKQIADESSSRINKDARELHAEMIEGIRSQAKHGSSSYQQIVNDCPEFTIRATAEQLRKEGFVVGFDTSSLNKKYDNCSLEVELQREP